MPHFKKHIFVCTNVRPPGNPKGSCAAKGSEELLSKLKAELRAHGLDKSVRANKSGCLDACEYGPTVVVYPDAVWYQNVQQGDLQEIVESHIIGGRPVERLLIPPPAEMEV